MGIWDRTSRFVGRTVSEVTQPAAQSFDAVQRFGRSGAQLGVGIGTGVGGVLLKGTGDVVSDVALAADEYAPTLSAVGQNLGAAINFSGDQALRASDTLVTKDLVRRTAVDGADAAVSATMAGAFYGNPHLAAAYVPSQGLIDAATMQEDYVSPMDHVYNVKSGIADDLSGRSEETPLEAHLRRIREAQEEQRRKVDWENLQDRKRDRTLKEADDSIERMRDTISGPAPMSTDTNTVHEHYATKASILAGPDGNQSTRGASANPLILLRSKDYQGIDSQWNAWRAGGGAWRGD